MPQCVTHSSALARIREEVRSSNSFDKECKQVLLFLSPTARPTFRLIFNIICFTCRCSLRSDCQDAAKDPLYWISYKSGRCTTITSVIPNQLQRTTARTVSNLFSQAHDRTLQVDETFALKWS